MTGRVYVLYAIMGKEMTEDYMLVGCCIDTVVNYWIMCSVVMFAQFENLADSDHGEVTLSEVPVCCSLFYFCTFSITASCSSLACFN